MITLLGFSKPVIICCLNCAPKSSSYTWSTEKLGSLIRLLNKFKKQYNSPLIYITGDINFDHTHWPTLTSTHSEEQDFVNILSDNNFQQLIQTTNGRGLDVVLTNDPTSIINVSIDNKLKTLFPSDHSHLVLTVPTTNDHGHWEWSLVYDWEASDVTDTNLVSKLINRFSYGIDQNVLRNLIRKEGHQKAYDYCLNRD